MLVQTITRFSIHGSNAEVTEIAPNVWVVVFHKIDFENKSSVYAGTKLCTSEDEAYYEAKFWLEKREEYDERSEAL